MSVLDLVRAETRLDLSNAKIAEEVLAGDISARLEEVIPGFTKARQTIGLMISTVSGLAAATTVPTAIGAMVGAAIATKKWLDGQVEAANSTSLSNLQRARDRFVEEYYGRDGFGWSAALSSSKAPKVPDVRNNVGGWSEAEFLAQYDPYYVFIVEKVGRNVIAPTWPTPPYDGAAMTPDNWCGGWKPDPNAPISGWARALAPAADYPTTHPLYIGPSWLPGMVYIRRLLTKQPDIGKLEDCEKFWGNAPLAGTMFENPYDTAIFESGYGIPQGYTYCFSWGTYPFLSWTTASNGLMGGNGVKYAHSAAAAAIHAAIHSPTPIHARIRLTEVVECYRQFLKVTGIRKLPKFPKDKQAEQGVYLDDEFLPWSPTAYLTVPRNADNTGSAKNYQIPWEVARSIELSYRSFFRVRRALMFDLRRATTPTQEAAATSPDLFLRTAAKFGPPTYEPWSEADPLGDGWIKPAKETHAPLPAKETYDLIWGRKS